MAAGRMIVMTNPVSPEREDDYNTWYNEIHAVEVVSLPGFSSMTRYRTKVQALPPADVPRLRYVAIYEMSDIDLAMKSMQEAGPNLRMTDAIDGANVESIVIEPIFSDTK